MAIAYCLHGFLGLPSDWDFLDGAIPIELRKVNVFRVLSPARGGSLSAWAEAFNAQVARESPDVRDARILVGYSMGGRLALHALIAEPDLWDAAILVSTNPGLGETDAKSRRDRLVQDEAWANRFESEAWDSVVAAWGSQPIFAWQGGARPAALDRSENKFSRADLAGALRHWSTGVQRDLSSALAKLPMPIAWVVGEEDHRHVDRARELGGPSLHKQAIPRAGHRVPWENAAAFVSTVTRFISPLLLVGPPEPKT